MVGSGFGINIPDPQHFTVSTHSRRGEERRTLGQNSVAEPHHLYAAPAPSKNFDAAPAPTLLLSKAKNF
jgi:hypothetical protein